MNRSESPITTAARLDRRALLRRSGAAISLGALLVACGEDRIGPTEPGRIGNAPPIPDPPDAPIGDAVFLRTAQSIEHTALDAYALALSLDVFNRRTTDIVERFVEDHTAHSEAITDLIVSNGMGMPFTCTNPWIQSRYVDPAIEAIENSGDPRRDVFQLAHALETLAGATYQLFSSMLEEPALRREAILIGTDEVRHAATLAIAATGSPDGYVSPALAGEEVFPDDAGFPIPFAIPSRFGQVTATELVVGERGEDGARLSLTIQTPAENAYVYDYMRC